MQQKKNYLQLNLFSTVDQEMNSYLEESFDKKMKSKSIIDLEEEVRLYQEENVVEAFNRIFFHFKPHFERIAGQQRDEDLIQELSEVLWNATKKFKLKSGIKFKTFFWTCVHNHIGTKKIRKNAQKRSGAKKVSIKSVNLITGQEEVITEVRNAQVVSFQSIVSSVDGSDTELGCFVEDERVRNHYMDTDFQICLEEFFNSGLLKENEKKAIKMVLNGDTLYEIGQALDGRSAPAIHFMLKRLAERKKVREYLLNILQ